MICINAAGFTGIKETGTDKIMPIISLSPLSWLQVSIISVIDML